MVAVATQMPREIALMCERMAHSIIDKNNLAVAMKINDIEPMDLISAGLERAVVVWPKYDASRGTQPQTLLHLAIERGMRDFIKREESQQRRKNGLAWEMGGSKKPQPKDNICPLAERLRRAYNCAKREYCDKYRQGRRLHDTPQLVAIAALMAHESLSCRECARLFATRADLREILRMNHLPSYNTIWKARKLLNKVVTTTADKTTEVVTEIDPDFAEVVTL